MKDLAWHLLCIIKYLTVNGGRGYRLVRPISNVAIEWR